jgi:hypothetical protein
MKSSPSETPKRGRPFLGVTFECCRIYQRIYLNAAKTAFVGWCPRCALKIEIKVDPNGERSQFFTVSR